MSIKGHYVAINHIDFKIETCFSPKRLNHLEPNLMKANGRMGIISYTNESGHMIKKAAMPVIW